MTGRLLDRVRAWTYRQQRLGAHAAAAPLDALRAVVGVYSAHPTAPLAVGARTQRPTGAGFRALEQRREALRIPAMRGSIFLVPRAHAGRLFAPYRQHIDRLTRMRLARLDLGLDDYARIAAAVLAAAQVPQRSRDLEEPAGLRGTALATVLRCLRHDGRILPVGGGSLRVEQFRYVATAAWAPGALDDKEPGDSLGWLAGEYLRAFGPARVADFAWWAGVPRREAEAAVGGLDTVDLGDGLLLPAADLADFERMVPLDGAVDLLPKWDAYTMGHAPDGRARFVHPHVQGRVYSGGGGGTLPGDGFPVVLVDGQAVGTWSLTVKDGAAVELFDTAGPRVRRRIDQALERAATLLAS